MNQQNHKRNPKDSEDLSGIAISLIVHTPMGCHGVRQLIPQQKSDNNGGEGGKGTDDNVLFVLLEDNSFSFQIRDPEHDLLQNGGIQLVVDKLALPLIPDQIRFLENG